MIVDLPYNWAPRNYQLPVWNYFEGPEEGKRAVCVWHRRAGKDLLAINLCSVKAHERIGTYWHLLPTYKQGRAIVWNGHTRDGRKFLDHFPKTLMDGDPNTTEMRVKFRNGSAYQVVGTDDINSLVGTNPVGCVFSEYSLHDPGAWEYIRPILAENGGWALFIYTARGKNHGYTLLNMARKNPRWFCQVLKAGSGPEGTRRPDGTPVISDAIIQEERNSGMPEEMVQQEFYCSFSAPFFGAYYGKQMTDAENAKRIREVPWEPQLPVETAWDLGVADDTAIWFVQTIGMEVRLIDYYESSGEGLPHYIKVLKEKPYTYGRHLAPHDIEVREFSTGKSRIDTARELGIKFTTVPKHEVMDGIEATRSMIASTWFDEARTMRGVEALRQYRKEWDEKNKCFRTNPLHDWTSHAADALRIFAWGRRRRGRREQAPQETAEDNYNYVDGQLSSQETYQ